ncbi:MAG: hypothetical protein AAF382_04870, partial [Pseudomonadota bacterium]
MRGLLRKIKRRNAGELEQARPEYLNIMLRGGRMTKVAGVAASFAPTLGTVGTTLSLGASSIALGTALSVSGAHAGNCGALGGGAYVCIGPANPAADVTQTFNYAGPVNVATADGFGLDTSVSGGNAFNFGSAATTSINFDELYGADITGDNTGLYAYGQAASTFVTLNTTGTITGNNGNGISVINNGSGDTTIVNQNATGTASVTGYFDGIRGYANGLTTNLSITANNVTAVTGDGIYGFSSGSGDLTITSTNAAGTAQVTGYDDGIDARHYGDGAVTITANNVSSTDNRGIYAYGDGSTTTMSITVDGTVESTNDSGIYARHYGSGDMTIAVTNAAGNAQVTANNYGINTRNEGDGALSITVNNVNTTNDTAIYAYGGNSSTTMSITADGTVDSVGYTGIYARHRGTGDVTITATNAAGDAQVTANNRGISSRVYYGATSITANNVTGSGSQGIYAYSGGGEISITATGVVDAGDNGIEVRNYGTEGTTINATNAAGDASVTGGNNGIYVYNQFGTGAVNVTTNNVTGTNTNGINIRANGVGGTTVTATNSAGTANVTGDNFGVYVYNYYDAANVTANNVSGDTSDGIYVRNAGASTDINVTTTGAVTSGSDDGIEARNYGTGTTTISSTNAAGDASVTGDDTGIYVYQNFAAGAVSVTANNATGTYGYGVYVRNFGSGDTTVNIANAAGTGAATGYNGGVYVYNQYDAANVTVDNAYSASGDGIRVYNAPTATSVSVTVNGNVTGNGTGIYVNNDGTEGVTITATNAAGTSQINGQSNDGIYVYNEFGGAVSVSANNVYGYDDGVYVYNSTDGTSVSVTTTGTVTSAYGTGINVENNGTEGVTVNATNADGTASVTGYYYGIYVDNFDGGAVDISADNVTGQNYDGIYAFNNSDGTSISVAVTGNVTGGYEGIHVYNGGTGDVTVTASNAAGTSQVTGLDDYGIYVDNNNGGSVTISANNVSGDEDGIYVKNDTDGTFVSVTTTGTVTSQQEDGIYIDNEGTGGVTVNATNPDGTADVTGYNYGVYVYNKNGGAVDVSVDNATGQNQDGVYVYNDGDGTTVSVTANGNVTGYDYGIRVENNGTGGVTITANNAAGTSQVTGQEYYGIYVDNNNGGAVVVSADNVAGYYDGILVNNDADGTTVSVTATGTVTSVNNDGIDVNNYGSGGITVNATNANGTALVDANAGDNGIEINNDNGGAVIVSADNVIGEDFGIEVDNDSDGTSVTVNVYGSVTSYDDDAINIDNNGTEGVTVTATNADQSVQIDSTTGDHGIYIDNNNGGAITVTVDNIVSEDEALDLNNDSDGTSIIVTAYGTIQSLTEEGIDIDNYGSEGVTVTVTNADGTAEVIADEDGIEIDNNNGGGVTVTVDNVTVLDENDAIDVDNDADGTFVNVTLNGTATTVDDRGIEVDNDGSEGVTVTATNADNTSLINSDDSDGVYVDNNNGGSVSVEVDIVTADDEGIQIENDVAGNSVDVTVNVSVTSNTQEGMFIENYGYGGVYVTATNATNSALVSGYFDGIFARNYSGGAIDITVDNVESQQSSGVDAYNDASGTSLSLTGYGTLSGYENGAFLNNEGTGDLIVNISNPDGTALAEGTYSGVDAYNENGGAVDVTVDNATGTNYYGIAAQNDASGTSLSVTSAGTTSGGYYAIIARNYGSGDLTIDSTNADGTAQATGGRTGIYARNTNGGAIDISANNVTGTTINGIEAYNDGLGTDLSVDTTGDVIGNTNGILVRNQGTGDVIVAATNADGTASVTGGTLGILARNYNGGATDVIADNVTGTTFAGIYASNDATGSTISITTYGDILGDSNGIEGFQNGTGLLSVTSSGRVTGAAFTGIYTNTGPGGQTLITLEDGADVSGGTYAIFNDAGDSDSYFNDGSTVSGVSVFNDGSDDLTIANADITGVTVLDGGDDSDVADGFVDLLTFSGFDGSFGADLLNWEGVIFDGSNATFTGAAITTPTMALTNNTTFSPSDPNFMLNSELSVD